jgi:hypothetical protein
MLAALVGPQAIEVMAGDDAGIHEFFAQQRRSKPAAPQAPAYAPSAPASPSLYRYAPADPFGAPAARAIERLERDELRPKAASKVEPLAASRYSPMGERAVCVRLCDGYHFPMGGVDGRANLETQAGMCESLCPGAPARLYVLPAGAESIDDAVSRDGRRYSALPVANRHASARDRTCSCRRGGDDDMSPVMSLFEDRTLRRGDGVMTPIGVRVFRGATRWPLRSRDFVSLAEADVSRRARSALTTVERASARQTIESRGKRPPAEREASAAPPAPSADAVRLVGPPTLPPSLR